jgi:hypothetical protein
LICGFFQQLQTSLDVLYHTFVPVFVHHPEPGL